MRQKPIIVIGGGLAGSEAAWQLAERGLDVNLFEMRPTRKTEAHQTSRLGELVCSNSFGSNQAHGASGILKSADERPENTARVAVAASCSTSTVTPSLPSAAA